MNECHKKSSILYHKSRFMNVNKKHHEQNHHHHDYHQSKINTSSEYDTEDRNILYLESEKSVIIFFAKYGIKPECFSIQP